MWAKGLYITTDLFIELWNVPDDYKNFATLIGHEHSISSVSFLPRDNQVVSSSRDHTVRMWDVQTRCVMPHSLFSYLTSSSKSLCKKSYDHTKNGSGLPFPVQTVGFS